MAGESNGRFRVNFELAIQVLAMLAAVFLAYGALDRRVSVLEDRLERLYPEIQEIKTDVKTLLRRP
jgi:hypothetical protein